MTLVKVSNEFTWLLTISSCHFYFIEWRYYSIRPLCCCFSVVVATPLVSSLDNPFKQDSCPRPKASVDRRKIQGYLALFEASDRSELNSLFTADKVLLKIRILGKIEHCFVASLVRRCFLVLFFSLLLDVWFMKISDVLALKDEMYVYSVHTCQLHLSCCACLESVIEVQCHWPLTIAILPIDRRSSRLRLRLTQTPQLIPAWVHVS